MNYDGTAGAAHAHAISNATRAMGSIIKVEPEEFLKIVNKQDQPTVVTATGWAFGTKYKYLTSYKGFVFYTRASAPLTLPGKAERIAAKDIWVPG